MRLFIFVLAACSKGSPTLDVTLRAEPGENGARGAIGAPGATGARGNPGAPCTGCFSDGELANHTRHLDVTHCACPLFGLAPGDARDSQTYVYDGDVGAHPAHYFGAEGDGTAVPATADNGRAFCLCQIVVPADIAPGTRMNGRVRVFTHGVVPEHLLIFTNVSRCLPAAVAASGDFLLESGGSFSNSIDCDGASGDRSCEIAVDSAIPSVGELSPGSSCNVLLSRYWVGVPSATTVEEAWLQSFTIDYQAVR